MTRIPDFAGSSYVIVQKYLHDMSEWNSLPVEEQENVIGRTKLDDLEMDDDIKPANSHTALTIIEDESGEQIQILRDNMPFGHVGSAELRHLLHRLLGVADGHRADADQHVHRRTRRQLRPHPRFLDRRHRQPFFVPTADFLDDPPDRADQARSRSDVHSAHLPTVRSESAASKRSTQQ